MSDLANHVTKAAFKILAVVLLLYADTTLAINCRIRLTPVNFGAYIPLTQTPVDVIGQINVRCQGQPGTFAVLIGPGLSGDQSARTLTAGGADVLNYNLYIDAARSQIWGNGNPPTFTVTGTRNRRGRPSRYNYPVYGRIFANQAPNPGAYADNLLTTVLF